MKKKFLFVIPALLGMFLSACGKDDSGTKTPDSGETPVDTGGQDGGNTNTVQYTVTFKDETGTILESKKWNEGATPSYLYEKQDTAEWDYTFNGWSLTLGGDVITLPVVSEDATYFAVVSQTKRSYTVAFYNENGTEIKSEVLEYGAQPTCDYTGPTDNAEWDYTFNGWSTTPNGTALPSIPTVSGAASYYAAVNSQKQTYLINFYDENGVLKTSNNVAYGSQPSCDYTGPADTAEWDYTFNGWSSTPNGTLLSSLPTVTENANYYALVSQVKNKYTITFDSKGGTSVASITEDYGTVVSKPTDPTKDDYHFTGWTTDADGNNLVSWPYTITGDIKLYAQWNEVINIKSYFQALLSEVEHDPYSYIPDTMRPQNSDNHVTASAVTYNFNEFNNVDDIKYGGFGEQWHMVVDNIKESERFYSVLSIGEAAMNASVTLFNNYLDNNPGNTASHPLNETEYTAMIDFHNGVLSYSIRYKTNLNIPFFGSVTPQIDMTYDVSSLEKAVRIQLTENNAMKYIVTDNSYSFGIEYGVSTVNRKAYFQINRLEDESVEGHIYEFVQFKDKDLVPACADFYIDDTYTSVVGNKASGMPGFSGYINELYKTDKGKLLGYEIRETATFPILGEKTYHTLWFNLDDISGINSVKAVENGNTIGGIGGRNPHDIYLNGSGSKFVPTKNGLASRKYDVELRKQYFYGYNEGVFTEYECELPMMFIQADHDEYTNFTDFSSDILKKSGITASVNLSSSYLDKIQEDYATLIDVFIGHKNDVTSVIIANYIGVAAEITE